MNMPDPPRPAFESLDREVLAFLREQAEENRKSLREDSQANREALLGTLKIVAYPMAVLIAVAGFLGWRSIDSLKRSIQDEARQETRAEISRMQEEAAQKSHAEIERMQREIRQKLSAQFETPQLQKMVKAAAQSQTQSVLRPLIVKEVGSDVAASVNQEQHTINSTLISETKKAVGQLEPKIDGIVTTRVNSTVDHAVDQKIESQIRPVLTSLQNNQQVSSLILRAQTDDARAFDALMSLAGAQATAPDVRDYATRVVRYIVQEHNTGIYMNRMFFQPKKDDEMLHLLSDPEAGTRQAALDSLSPAAVEGNMDRIVQIMTTDPSLAVREAAFRRFSQARNEPDRARQILNLDNASALQWWNTNRTEFIRKHPQAITSDKSASR